MTLPVSDLAVSLAFYERALGARHVPELDHHGDEGRTDAVVVAVPDLGFRLQLRHDPARASRHHGFDPVAMTVTDRAALGAWEKHLTAVEVPHSEVLTGERDWLVVMADPDGNRLRLATRETHGPELAPERTDWLYAWCCPGDPGQR